MRSNVTVVCKEAREADALSSKVYTITCFVLHVSCHKVTSPQNSAD